jgi:hypothetical protein
MSAGTPRTEIPLGVECAWPFFLTPPVVESAPRRQRLKEAWRRVAAVFGSGRCRRWAD